MTRTACTVTGCDRPPIARGLCRMHYSRQRRGAPLADSGPQRGDVDGYGRYGILDEDDDGVLCHECGTRHQGLGMHVHAVHEMTAREYKLAHGLPLSRSLSSTAYREALSARSLARVGTAAWARLEDARDPAAAAAARDPLILTRAAGIRGPEHAASNGRAGRTRQVVGCVVCGVQWCPLPGHYRRETCSPQCLSILRHDARAPRTDSHRDGRIRLRVLRLAEPIEDVAADYGLTPRRVEQIVGRGVRDRQRLTRASWQVRTRDQLRQLIRDARSTTRLTDAAIATALDVPLGAVERVEHKPTGPYLPISYIARLLREYTDTHDGLNPPALTAGNYAEDWHRQVVDLRARRRAGSLHAADIARLDAAGMDWDPPIGRRPDRLGSESTSSACLGFDSASNHEQLP